VAKILAKIKAINGSKRKAGGKTGFSDMG